MKRPAYILRLTCLAVLLSMAAGCSSSSGGATNGLDGQGGEFSDQDLTLAEKQRWGDGNIPLAQQGSNLFQDIHFDYDSALISPEDQQKVRDNAQELIKDRNLFIELEGHCDERGTNEYNLALGEERARAVARLMVGYGVEPRQIKTISYGEEIPLDTRSTEDAYAKNRRVHFAPYYLSGNQTR